MSLDLDAEIEWRYKYKIITNVAIAVVCIVATLAAYDHFLTRSYLAKGYIYKQVKESSQTEATYKYRWVLPTKGEL